MTRRYSVDTGLRCGTWELGGKTIRRGDFVQPVLAAANRDPEQFPHPDRLDITREKQPPPLFRSGTSLLSWRGPVPGWRLRWRSPGC